MQSRGLAHGWISSGTRLNAAVCFVRCLGHPDYVSNNPTEWRVCNSCAEVGQFRVGAQMARIRHLFEADSTHSSLKEYDPSAVSGRTKTPVSNFVQLTMNGRRGIHRFLCDMQPVRQYLPIGCYYSQVACWHSILFSRQEKRIYFRGSVSRIS